MNFLKIIFMYVAVCLAACSSLMPIRPQDFGSLKPGELVEVETVAGDHYRFKIDSVTAQGIKGDGHHVAYDDIKEISRMQTDPGDTGALITLAVVFLGLVALSLEVFDLFK